MYEQETVEISYHLLILQPTITRTLGYFYLIVKVSDYFQLRLRLFHYQSNFQVKGAKLKLWIYLGTATPQEVTSPFCSFVNVELVNDIPRMGSQGKHATVLLENPRGDFPLSVSQLKHQVCEHLFSKH